MPQIEKLATENLTVAIFRTHSSKNEKASRAAGRPIYDDIEVCELRFAANKQTVGVFPAHEIFKWHTDPETGDREPLTYALAYPDQYRKWKNGEAQVASGTPLSELTFLTQGKRLELKALNIHTAEALAALDGLGLKQLGPNGRMLKDQAQAYIDAASGTADATGMAGRIAELEGLVRDLMAGKAVGATSPIPNAAAESETDEDQDSEEDGGGDDGGDPPEPSPFEIMADEDIVNWLKETTKKTPKKNLSHAALVKLADEVNAALAAAKTADAA